MSTITTLQPPRELAYRSSSGIDVTLMWHPVSDTVSVFVVDLVSGDAFEVEVGNANPMHVFHHPYAYARMAA